MATSLSEDPTTRVVLLEAGGEDTNFWIHIPLGYGKTFADRGELVLRDRARSRRQRPPDLLAARQGVGWIVVDQRHGLHPRPARGLRPWRQLGNPGWSTSDVLPYFKRAEHQTRGEDDLHGTGGRFAYPIDARPSDLRGLHEAAWSSVPAQRRLQRREPGRRRLSADHDAERQRCSTAVGYLHPVMKRPNLRVITGALTERCCSRASAPSASRSARRRRRNRARAREVILCGGAMGSPQLLLLSGVGPAVAPCGFGHSGGARPAGRRAESAGSLLGADEVASAACRSHSTT